MFLNRANQMARCALWTLAVLCLNCQGPPTVTHTSRSKEIHTVSRWQVIANPDIVFVGKDGRVDRGADNVAQMRVATYLADFLNRTKEELTKQAGISFYDNPPFDGILRVHLHGQVRFSLDDKTDASGHVTPPEYAPNAEGRRDTKETISPVYARLDDRIDSVTVVATNAEGKILGETRLNTHVSEWSSTRSIKPKDVAYVVSVMLRP